MKLVLDANVWLSGIPRLREQSSPPRKLIAMWLAGQFDPVISDHIIEEVIRNFRKPYFASLLRETEVADVFAEVYRLAEIVDLAPDAQVPALASHPEDDYVLATARTGHADFLVTGDKQLQHLQSIGDIAINSPAQMLRILEAQRDR